MTPLKIIQTALKDGVSISPDGTGNIKLSGNQAMVDKWLPTIKENKTAILAVLSSNKDDSTPEVCKGCHRFDAVVIKGVDVPGCLYQITDGEWSEGWKRLPLDIKWCIIH
jgi:hypothetical protein